MAYTFHEEVETSPYTYHSEQQLNTLSVAATFNGSVWTWSCPAGYSDGGGQWGVGICKGTVTASVKDAPPTGWYDTGSAYGQTVDVKDAHAHGLPRRRHAVGDDRRQDLDGGAAPSAPSLLSTLAGSV